ncbi:MAG: hypothetical protein JNG89_07950, partial [Planctomycetaceae bacterium]|nr:hypothetical protein [Planctomycetaceae bacterium]
AALIVGDAGLTHSQSLVYRVRQGSLNEITLRAPLGLSLKRIAGPDVGGWELSDQGDARQFRVFLRRAVDDETALTIEFHQPLSVTDQPQTVAVPEISLENVTRETGTIGIFAAEHFVVRATAAGGTQINASTFSAPLIGGLPSEAARLAFRFSARPVGVELSVSRRQPETRAVVQHGVRVELRKLHIASRMAIELAGAPRLALSFDLPAGYLPLNVQAQYLADWYVSGADDARVLTIELDQPRTGAIEVVLEGHIQRQPDDAAAAIDLPQPLSVNRLQSQLAVWLDSSYSATLETLGEWKSIDPALLADVVRGLNPQPPQFAFQSTSGAPQAVTVSVSRATPQLSADAITLAAVSESSVDYGLTLRWRIRQAAAETFVIVTPGWLKGLLEFTGAGIRDVAQADVPDGRVRWTITLVDPVEIEYLLSAVATLPPPANLQVALPDVQFEQPGDGGTFTPLATQAQYAVLVNLSGWQMSPVDPALMNSISRDELPFELRDELLNQAMEIVRIAAGSTPAWKLERLQQVAASEATVTACDLQTALDYDGSWRMKAIYTVRNRGRQFLALNIPEGARVLSVFVRGAPSRTVLTTLQDKPVQLVALPQTSVSDLSFDVELVLAGRLPAPLPEGFHPAARQIELPAPTVVTREQAEAGGRADLGTPVIHTQWRVQLPDGIDAMIVDGAGRSNVTPDVTDLVLARVEADIFACVQVLRDPFASKQQKAVVANNLKSLNLTLQQHAAQSGSDPYSSGPDIGVQQPARAESLARNRELQKQVEDNVREFEAANGVLDGTATLQVPASSDDGRAYIMSNSAQILDDNGDFGVAGATPESDKTRFNFSLTQPQVTPMFEENLAARKGGRGELRQQLQEQSVDEAEQLSRRLRESGVGELESHTIRDGQPLQASERWYWEDNGNVQPRAGQTWNFRRFSDYYADNTLALGAVEFGGFVGGEFDTQAGAPAWTSAGGLSLPLTIPAAEQELRFSKVGGDPKLTLSIRPRRTLTLGLGALWTAVCLLGGIWLLRTATRNEGREAWRAVPKAMMAVGLLGFLLIPGDFRWVLFAAFALGALAYAVQLRHHPVTDEE